MASFTVRVELHDADWDDYEQLHGYMKKEGFARTIRSDDGITYHLPTAEYNLENVNLTGAAVLEKAKRAATKTGKKFGVLVTESNSRTWYGLEQVR